MKVLLVGNYAPDAQQSMLRFAEMMERELRARGHEVRLLSPSARFNRRGAPPSGMAKWLGYLDKFVVFPRVLKQAARRADVVHICDHSNAPYVRVLKRVPHLVTCHDVMAIRSALGHWPQNPTGLSGRILQRFILGGLNRARHVVCDSQNTRQKLLSIARLAPQQTEVVYIGLNYPYAPLPPAEVETRLRALFARFGAGDSALRRGFILHVGNNSWYKNRPGVLAIYAALRRVPEFAPAPAEMPMLVMAGGPLSDEMRAFVRENGLHDAVCELEGVSNEELRALYCGARLLLFPSLSEGFGWPVLEAGACGCPVFTSRRASLPEVGGEAVCYVEPDAPEDAARVLAAFLCGAPQARDAQEMKRAGLENATCFSLPNMMDGYLHAYEQVIAQANSSS